MRRCFLNPLIPRSSSTDDKRRHSKCQASSRPRCPSNRECPHRPPIPIAMATKDHDLTRAHEKTPPKNKQAHLRARALENGSGGRRCRRCCDLLVDLNLNPFDFDPVPPRGLQPPRGPAVSALGLRLGIRRQRARQARCASGAGAVALGLGRRRGKNLFSSFFLFFLDLDLFFFLLPPSFFFLSPNQESPATTATAAAAEATSPPIFLLSV